MADMTVSEMARKGGYARASALSKAERVEIARKAGSAPKRPRSKTKKARSVSRGLKSGDASYSPKTKSSLGTVVGSGKPKQKKGN